MGGEGGEARRREHGGYDVAQIPTESLLSHGDFAYLLSREQTFACKQ